LAGACDIPERITDEIVPEVIALRCFGYVVPSWIVIGRECSQREENQNRKSYRNDRPSEKSDIHIQEPTSEYFVNQTLL